MDAAASPPPPLAPLLITHAASGATLAIHLFGAQIVSYAWRGQDALFMSTRACLDGSKPIRGGIPLAFPQFAAQGALPMHGFARTATWALERRGDGEVELSLQDSPATLALWPHAFRLTLTASFDGPTLRTALRVANPAGAPAPFAFEALQHTYLAGGAGAVDEAGTGALSLSGLQGLAYFEKPTARAGVEERGAFRLQGEVDRVYHAAPSGAPAPAVVVTGVQGPAFHAVTVRRSGQAGGAGVAADAPPTPMDVVVWNPGPVRAAAIADLGPEDWRAYVCVEPGRVSAASAQAGLLAPGQHFTLTQELLLE